MSNFTENTGYFAGPGPPAEPAALGRFIRHMQLRDSRPISGWNATILVGAILLMALALGVTWSRVARLESAVERMDRTISAMMASQDSALAPISPLLLDYELDLPGRGEIFPAMVSSGAPDYWP